ncbi:MAG: glutamine-hydrolyzing carbamoyl-phosphate synthase small subunit [Verrucomicrobia bacterium]|nr:glutamine-hydrolyzing carbamoyl-phosphate synthase small subunit [Verrucomicrobiota bacterium]MDA1087784.1 glutamine-hydrolyzing carbamoyl-phosphate synthase small subunit [Verrucomicrobiota bacterium]
MSSDWNWRQQRDKSAYLALEDGTVLRGYSFGASTDRVGEVIFNTGMAGYQEILTDPSYAGQLVTMTYPEIGNTGINQEDRESRRLFLNGFITHSQNRASNWRSDQSLSDCLVAADVPAIAGIDTRALTTRLRDKGSLKGYLCASGALAEAEGIAAAREWEGLDGQDYASRVTCDDAYTWDEDGSLTRSWGITEDLPEADLSIVAIDFGIKWNILRSMRRSGINVHVVPATTSADDILKHNPDGIFLSNGPADPDAVTYAIDTVSHLIGKKPIMGICLGHQILGLACGGKRFRLKFGHHGCNHPVKDLATDRVEITSQNHNFAIDADSLDLSKVEITHINLNDQTVEGIRHRNEPMFGVQYHPESSPGPHDPFYLFDRFRAMIENA